MSFRILVSDAETRKAFDVFSIISFSFKDIPIVAGDIEGTCASERHLRRLFHCDVATLRISDEDLFDKDLRAISEKDRKSVV